MAISGALWVAAGGYIESFNGKFRDEHLNECWFQTLHQARMAVAVWRTDYNDVKPHSS